MTDTTDKAAAKPLRCPICKADAVAKYRPFCSRRCADVDLGRWFSGSYAVAGSGDSEDDQPAPPEAFDGEPDAPPR